ncbi:hypothetical protein ACFQ93_22050 [Streptomyces sp. NPDC056601]|uniref:hypothetical protein n=1 Tax=Streptomyces sp. NPDC056601 TaxID=3345875 RepID=UPI00368CBA23
MSRRVGRSLVGRVVGRGRGRAVSALGAAMCAVAVPLVVVALPGVAAAQDSASYVFAQGAMTVQGAMTSTDAAELKSGETYRSSIEAGVKGTGLGSGSGAKGAAGTRYYRVALDGSSDTYVSAVAVPKAGADVKLAFNDSISVTLQDRQGNRCDSEVAAFRSAEYPRPIAATAERVVREGGGRCQDAGTYDVVVARKTAPDSTRERWALELRVSSEPALKSPPATTGPGAWSSTAPRPPAGIPFERRGGTGFNDARSLRQGVWKDRIRPGQTLFYRVPLDWGQQLFTEAELGSSAGDAQRKGFVPSALNVTLFNPARTPVTSKDASYGGEPSVAALDSLPPVAYENRYLSRADEAGVRFAGWYYLRVSLTPEMKGTFGNKESGLTLRLTVHGDAASAPTYVRDPGVFQVTAADRAAAERGFAQGGGSSLPSGGSRSGGQGGGQAEPGASGRTNRMTVVGIAGIGTGSVLVLGLGVWTYVARRRAPAGW